MNDMEVMNILSKMAKASEPFAKVRLAAGLVYKNDIIAIGTNRNKSHPFQKKYASNSEAIFLHAETDAIYNAIKKYNVDVLSKSTMYVCRIKWKDEKKNQLIFGLAKPCVGCQRAIATFNIKHVCYSLDEEGIDYL